MYRTLWIATSLSLLACGSTKDESGDSGAAEDMGCPNSILEEFPESGTDSAFYRTSVEFTLATADAAASISLSDEAGTDVPGTSSVVDNRVVFKPSSPLSSSTTYNATMDWECGPTSVTWMTSGVGDPIEDVGGLVDQTYSLDLASGRFVQPAGVGDILGSLLEFELFIGVTKADASSINMIGALSDDSGLAQDLCTETIDFPVAASFGENPYFEIVSDSLPIAVEDFVVVIEDMELSGAFSADASSVEGVVLAGKIDTRPLVDLVSPGGGENDVCVLMQTFSVDCEECGDGSGPFCLTVFVDSMTATGVDDLTITPRTADDIALDAACDTGSTGT
jgi:hypothetical protein